MPVDTSCWGPWTSTTSGPRLVLASRYVATRVPPVCLTRPPPSVHTQLFEQVSGFSRLLQQTQWMGERIRFLLGGAEVVLSERPGSVRGIAEHYTALSVFHRNLLSRRLRLHPRSLQGLRLLLDTYAVDSQFLSTRRCTASSRPTVPTVSPQ